MDTETESKASGEEGPDAGGGANIDDIVRLLRAQNDRLFYYVQRAYEGTTTTEDYDGMLDMLMARYPDDV